MIEKEVLENYYITERFSMAEIAVILGCSIHRVTYWMDKHGLVRRSISDAVYQRSNPGGDPFRIVPLTTRNQHMILGMGLGLYWGEGNKTNLTSVRLGNTDPALIKTFIKFLEEIFDINKDKLRFSLQIFSDTEEDVAVAYWKKALNMPNLQLGKVVITKSGSLGTYRNKNQFGVMTVHFHNRKLRDIIVGMLPR